MNETQQNSLITTTELILGKVFLIDKPLEWTSFDVVNKIKGACKSHPDLKKIKIGHAGTLDPLATGLLVVCTGKMTKSIVNFQDGEKEYTGTIFLGKTTPSFDLETQPEGEFATDHITFELCIDAAKKLTGLISQTPPSFSAKKIDGKRAYKSAHKGIEVEMRPVPVTVHEFEIVGFEFPIVQFRIRCSKGTYIRSLANDFGKELHSGAYLNSLRRTKSHPFCVESAHQLTKIVDEIRQLK